MFFSRESQPKTYPICGRSAQSPRLMDEKALKRANRLAGAPRHPKTQRLGTNGLVRTEGPATARAIWVGYQFRLNKNNRCGFTPCFWPSLFLSIDYVDDLDGTSYPETLWRVLQHPAQLQVMPPDVAIG